MAERLFYLGCEPCGCVRPHRFYLSKFGGLAEAPKDSEKRLLEAQALVPTPRPTSVEQQYQCETCQAIRRWGLDSVA